MRLFRLLAAILALMAPLGAAGADVPLVVAVEDKDWVPHYRWIGGQPVGPDTEVVARVLDTLGHDVRFEAFPWKRAVEMVTAARVDALLDMAITEERRARLYFPDEVLTLEQAVLWVAADSPLTHYPGSFEGLAEAGGRLFGVMRGVARIKRLAWAEGITPIVYDQWDDLLTGLVAGRIDVAGGYRQATGYEAAKAGLLDRIRPLDPPIETVPYYLGFAPKPGYGTLARVFSDALRAFKASPAYAAVYAKHGVPPPDTR